MDTTTRLANGINVETDDFAAGIELAQNAGGFDVCLVVTKLSTDHRPIANKIIDLEKLVFNPQNPNEVNKKLLNLNKIEVDFGINNDFPHNVIPVDTQPNDHNSQDTLKPSISIRKINKKLNENITSPSPNKSKKSKKISTNQQSGSRNSMEDSLVFSLHDEASEKSSQGHRFTIQASQINTAKAGDILVSDQLDVTEVSTIQMQPSIPTTDTKAFFATPDTHKTKLGYQIQIDTVQNQINPFTTIPVTDKKRVDHLINQHQSGKKMHFNHKPPTSSKKIKNKVGEEYLFQSNKIADEWGSVNKSQMNSQVLNINKRELRFDSQQTSNAHSDVSSN